MILYVSLEHDRLQADPLKWQQSLARLLKHKYRFENLTGDQCLIVRYDHLSLHLLEGYRPRAVVVSGCFTDFVHYSEESLASLRALYRAATQPILGFCGGHQLMAQAYGAPIGAMGQLAPGESHVYAQEAIFDARMKQEYGFLSVDVCAPHPLFADLKERITVFQAHYWEVKAPPVGFRVLAGSALCGIQAMAHVERPLYGIQFHPEEYDDEHPDGRRILENFFSLVQRSTA